MLATTPSYRTLGNALRFLGLSLKQFRQVQAQLGIVPVRIADDVEEFDDNDIQRMAKGEFSLWSSAAPDRSQTDGKTHAVLGVNRGS